MSAAERERGGHGAGRRAAAVMGEPGAAAGTTVVTGAAPDERTERFIELSVILTGFGRVELTGTGLAGTYLRAIDAALPAGVADDLLDALGKRAAPARAPIPVPAPAPAPGQPGRDVAAVGAVLDDPRLGPVARNLIVLWYCGTWTALPDEWRAAYGSSPGDVTRVVSAAAYQGGLQWAAAGAHPAGARQQGFGAWSSAPQGRRG